MIEGLSSVLVTGGAGFIGSHLVDRLVAEELDVTVLDNLTTGTLANLGDVQSSTRFRFVEGDVRDPRAVQKALKDVDVVFHEAAFVNVPLSVEDPLTTNDINVAGTLNVLKECVDAGVRHFIFASSCAVYGASRSSLVKETDLPHPASPYAASKLAAETYINAFCRVHGLKALILRYFNVYGTRQSFDAGNPYCGVVPIFLNRIQQGLLITIHGDGKQTRDFVNVRDVVEANLLALKHCEDAGGVFNVGSGQATSVNQVATAVGNVLHRKLINKEYSTPRPGDIRRSCADIRRAKQVLGYAPQVSFEQGLQELVDWRSAA